MVVFCFDTLQAHFSGHQAPAPRFDVNEKLCVLLSIVVSLFALGVYLRVPPLAVRCS